MPLQPLVLLNVNLGAPVSVFADAMASQLLLFIVARSSCLLNILFAS